MAVTSLDLQPGPQTAPRGPERSCKSWAAEGALRCLLNNLDAEVAEDPARLVVYGGTGKAARDWDSLRAIVRTLQRLEPDETLLVQSGKPVAVFRTHPSSPRVLIANSNLVGNWANWEHFRELEAAGKMMYGQMTAGSWIYIGSQGIVQGTYETFAAAAKQHFGGTLAGRLVVTAGLGGMGGAQPLAATMNEATCLAAEVDRERIQKRLDTGYTDVLIEDLDRAIDQALEWKQQAVAKSIGVLCNATELLRRLIERDVTPDVLTDQTSAHDPLGGYVPDRMELAAALELRAADPKRYEAESFRTMKAHCELMIELQKRGADTFDYGNNLRGHALGSGSRERLRLRGLRPQVRAAAVLRGQGPVPLDGALGRPQGHRGDRPHHLRAVPRRRSADALDQAGGGANSVPRAAGPDLLAGLRRSGEGRAGVQRGGAPGRDLGAPGDRSRPPRLRLGGFAQPRDRGHAGRYGRGRRLAAAQLHAERGIGRVVGFLPPWRWSRHGLQPPRRSGHRRGRLARGGRGTRARADQRPRNGRDAARGRRAIPRPRPALGKRASTCRWDRSLRA